MKLTAIVASLTLALNLYGQKCDYLVNTVSGMDGSHLVITETARFTKDFDGMALEVYASLYADTAVMLSFVINGSTDFDLHAGDYIFLGNGSEKNLELVIWQEPVKVTKGTPKTTCNVLLSKEQAKAITDIAVTELRFTSGETDLTATVDKKKDATAIGDKLSCVLAFI